MKKILNQQYQGYKFGLKANREVAKDCHLNTQLMPDQGTKRIFNFSYYHPDGEPEVISFIGEGASSEQKEIPFWKKWGLVLDIQVV
jgi:hypothetical protein